MTLDIKGASEINMDVFSVEIQSTNSLLCGEHLKRVQIPVLNQKSVNFSFDFVLNLIMIMKQVQST